MNNLPVIVSFLLALLLTSLPIPETAVMFRPEWLVLVLIYWCMATPERIGIFTGWLMGLILDVMYGSMLGQNAMSLSVIAYLVGILHLRVRMFPLWQQSVLVFVLVLVHLGINAWIRGITGQFTIVWTYWTPALTSALVWPFLFILLRDLGRQQIKR
jgi:rod shape-determining protein MreD